ncbi:hypothetical protein [Bradyrhizobium niftali]|nr:hypothetical protein [Bradyrhizobium niftali]
MYSALSFLSISLLTNALFFVVMRAVGNSEWRCSAEEAYPSISGSIGLAG